MINTNESNLAEGIGFQPGEEIGRYEVVARLAIGGQSIIYKCHDPALDRMVAIKQISTHLAEDKMFLDRFRTEAQILARLGGEQPEVVTIHDLLENKQGLFIVMEFVEGVSLERTLSDNPDPVELKATLQILWRLCSALHTVHAAGVIHRDIKPSNVIIADGLRPMITDFGVAATSSGEASMVMGTTKYMAPELFTGGYVDGRADMYSLGFIAYEMLVGREKFNEIFADVVRDRTAEKVRWMKWHSNPKVSAPPPHEVNSAVPITLSSIVLKMIAKDSEQRFAGMEDLGRAIKLTFRPGGGGKVAGSAQVPVAPPVDDETVSISAKRAAAATPFDTEDAVTAPIPKLKLSLGAKLSIGAAALVIIVGGIVLRGYLQGQEKGETRGTAKAAFAVARDLYEKDGKYVEAEAKFQAVRSDFAETVYAPISQVYISMCKAHMAVEGLDWARAQAEQDTASIMTRKLQKKYDADGPVHKWTEKMKIIIDDFESYRIEQKAFFEHMGQADKLYAQGEYDKAVALLESKYEGKYDNLTEAQVGQIQAFSTKVERKVASDKCDKLLAAARKTEGGDSAVASAAWEAVAAGLSEHKANISESKWKSMDAEVRRTKAKYAKDKWLQDILKTVKDARESGDKTRLLKALKAAMLKPGVPSGYVKGWASEIRRIQEELDYGKIKALLVEGDTVETIAALDVFIDKYPKNRRAQLIREGLQKKLNETKFEKEAFGLFDLEKWPEALKKLEILRAKHRGRRDIKEKVLYCKYKLAMIDFKAAVKAGKYSAARAAGDRVKLNNPDAYDVEVAPILLDIDAKAKIAKTLQDGQDALAAKQYRKARNTVEHLKVSHPEAAELIRRSKYLETLARAHKYRDSNDIKTAWATYKTAKSYAKHAEEHKEVDALIAATALGAD